MKIVDIGNKKLLKIRRTNTGMNCKQRQMIKLIKTMKKNKKQKLKHKKKKKRISLNTGLTISKLAMIHGENWEFKGRVLFRIIQKLKSLTPTSAILISNTLIYELNLKAR